MTLYAIIANNTITAVGRPGELWPDTSFSILGPNAAWLAEYNAQEVREFRSYNTETERLRIVDPYLEDGLVYRVAVEPLPPTAPIPDYETFVDTVTDSNQWNTLIGTIAATKPGAAQVLAGALSAVAYGNYALFLRMWRRLRLADQITAGQVTAIQGVATTNNLPVEFISALAPTP